MFRRIVVSILAALTMFAGTQIVAPTAALADTYNVVYHRPTSQIPTIRVWEGLGTGDWMDLQRGSTTGHFNGPVDPNYVYIPVGWCMEANLYNNGVMYAQQRSGPGPRWYNTGAVNVYYSIFMHDPGADGICN